MNELLQIRALDTFYGDFQALFGVSMEIASGEVVAVIGANGAGKSTLLQSIAGLIRSRRDAINFAGEPIGDMAAHARVRRGIALVPEGRRLFPSLTVEENLIIGGQLGRIGPWTLPRIYELFPVLAERRNLPSTSLSGGQQQMVAIGRALMTGPKVLLLDEPSMGLAPVLVEQIFNAIDLLCAAFPGGSITGAPKIRAMEIIAELEPTRRGPYCGSIGYVGFDGSMDTSIVIRTICIRGRQLTFQVGGGIVADSDPAAEYEESLTKAKALIEVLSGAAP